MNVLRNWAVIGLLVIDLVLATVFVYGWVMWDPESGAVESIAAFVIAPLAISLAITALTIIGLLAYRYASEEHSTADCVHSVVIAKIGLALVPKTSLSHAISASGGQ